MNVSSCVPFWLKVHTDETGTSFRLLNFSSFMVDDAPLIDLSVLDAGCCLVVSDSEDDTGQEQTARLSTDPVLIDPYGGSFLEAAGLDVADGGDGN